MLNYKQDPTLPRKVITLFNGEQEYRDLCTKLRGEYYTKNVHAFEVNNKWYREDSGLIDKDHETKKWFLLSEGFLRSRGVVGFKDGKAIMGYFTRNPYNNVEVKLPFDRAMAINPDILVENGFVEDISTGVWHDRKSLTPYNVRALGTISNKQSFNHKGYNIEDNKGEAELKDELFEKYDLELTKDVRRYARFLNDTTYGLELECSQGFIPEHIQNRTNVVICKDGSIVDRDGNYPPEFVTNPLSGAKGLQNIVNLSNELKKRTNIDVKCSLHLHLGNLPTSRLFLVSLYVLAYKIQDDVYKMFPHYKTDWRVSGKEKDYCKKLKKMNMGIMKVSSKEDYDLYINSNYQKIFYWLSQNETGSGYNPSQEWSRKSQSHPVAQKWHRPNRYYWLNLMNVLFSSRNTVEFRIHTPTVNSQKIINWLFICNAIVRYAILHSKEILTSSKKISLESILDYYKDTFRISQAAFLSEYLKAYVKERTEYFEADYKKGDYLSQAELESDKTYEFVFGSTSHLF